MPSLLLTASVAALSATLGVPSSSVSASPATSQEAEIRAECAALVGDAQDQQRAKELRRERLERIVPDPYAYTVVYRGDWDAPTPIDDPTLTLIATAPTSEPPYAIVELGDAAARALDCPAGLYRVEIDNALGPDASVLAILDDVLLIAHDGKLAYLQVADRPSPVWRMMWHAPFSIHRPRTASPPARRTPARRSPRRGR